MRFSATSRRRNSRPHRQPAFTLMEVIIALAVLGMSMVAIGTLIQIGGQNALQARLLTTAQFLAETKLSEVKAGIIGWGKNTLLLADLLTRYAKNIEFL